MSDFSTEKMTVKCVERHPALEKRNRISRHLPTYFEGFEKEAIEFDTLEELLNIEFVKSFSKNYKNDIFYGFSLSRHMFGVEPIKRPLLIASYNERKKWWVVGYLDKDIPELPEWEPDYDEEVK